jgi:hypothetical protein
MRPERFQKNTSRNRQQLKQERLHHSTAETLQQGATALGLVLE